MRKIFFSTAFFLAGSIILASGPTVPATMEFAGIKLKLTEAARRDIQKDVDMLTRHKTSFDRRVDKMKMFFPIIERAFREEGVPTDFKYLSVQESGLIADAVSSSNAVGYWQFKDFTALEQGLRVDRQIDERMNIVSASHGAAKYMKKNNFFFDNWLYALQAYQMGRGGAQKVVNKKYFGAKKMNIDKKTYWYVKRFLAHKIAFEEAMNTPAKASLTLVEYTRGTDKSIAQIAKELGVDEDSLREYNKWLKRGKIPDDKTYTVIVPTTNVDLINFVSEKEVLHASNLPRVDIIVNENNRFPIINANSIGGNGRVHKTNGIPAIRANESENFDWMAMQGTITLEKFKNYNDLGETSSPKVGQVYYLAKKKRKAQTHYHIVQKGETLWDISQKYGLRLKKLRQKNRMKNDKLKAKRVLWLRFIRPSDVPIEYRSLEPIKPKLIPVQKTIIDSISVKKTLLVDSIFVEEPTNDSLPSKSIPEIVDPVIEADTESSDSSQFISIEPFSKPDEKEHIVLAGETLYRISKLYDVQIVEILNWNNLNINESLKTGQKLIIHPIDQIEDTITPAQKALPNDFYWYEVKAGDNLYKIARSEGVTIGELMELNQKEDSSVKLGEKIKINRKEY